LEAEWRGKHGDRYVKRNMGQVTTLRDWAEFTGRKRLVSSLTRDDFIFYVEHESKRGLQASSSARHINAVLLHAEPHCKSASCENYAGCAFCLSNRTIYAPTKLHTIALNAFLRMRMRPPRHRRVDAPLLHEDAARG
jgi:hypothetical protein